MLVPATLPWIFIGMRIVARHAFTNTLLAELIASNSGIGFMIEYYSGVFDATVTYAAILVLVIMSVGLTEFAPYADRDQNVARQVEGGMT